MKKAFIYTGGSILPENITEHPKADDIVIAADSGYKNALSLGERVEILLGDFDSLEVKDIPKSVEVLTFIFVKAFCLNVEKGRGVKLVSHNVAVFFGEKFFSLKF